MILSKALSENTGTSGRIADHPACSAETLCVGVVGLGRMGAAFASNLIQDSFKTVVFDRDTQKARTFAQGRAVAAGSYEALSDCDVVISMVPDDAAIRSVAEQLSGVLATNAVHVSMSTISPDAAREAAHVHYTVGQGYLSAPVLGNPDLAAARKLYILAAGASETIARCMPVLERLGQRVFVLGEVPELANTFKLAGNVLTASTMQSMGEVLAFLRKAGVDPHVAFSVLTESLFDGKVHKAYGGKIVNQRYAPPGMTVPLAVKDLRLALTEAETLRTPMPIASVVRDRLVAASARGWDDLDWSVLGKLAAFSAGL
ncbi:NAD(P)-dependent oxidoreductase [Paraburkholderia sp. JPY169]|uniref:NAD(P)-dependent oxidoreductase n=1 Tax=Paraburkholderia youngii TaxID=2782701 RepID=A0A7Y6K2S6_9BURK|nr:NAD(P)-dependent oxidoreductase [Paraburkholderia youngii]